jgi:hypothetical protein
MGKSIAKLLGMAPPKAVQPDEEGDARREESASEAARKRLRGQEGRQSTILTGGAGVQNGASTTRKVLLGR